MANTKQANKRCRQAAKRRMINKNKISELKSARKSFSADPSLQSLSSLQKKLDQSSTKGLISKKRASRLISRARKGLSA